MRINLKSNSKSNIIHSALAKKTYIKKISNLNNNNF